MSNRSKELQAPIFMPLNVDLEGQTEKVFERIEKEWGKLDILLHSIAFSPTRTRATRST
jgi:enoyl-[acyl-carrier protein] reductase I